MVKFNPSVLALSTLCFISPPLFAARAIDLSTEPLPLPQGARSITAAVTPQIPLSETSRHTDNNQVTHVRMQQTYNNYPVWGADAVVHLPKTTNEMTGKNLVSTLETNPTASKNGVVYADLNQDIGSADPAKFDNEAGKQNAIDVLKQSQALSGSYNYGDQEAKVIVYVDDNKKAHTAYLVSLLATNASEIKRPTAIIDAQDHTIYKQWDNIKTDQALFPAKARGFGGNPLTGKVEYGYDKPSLAISRDANTKTCYFKNDQIVVLKKIDLTDAPANDISFKCVRLNNNSYREPDSGYFGQSNKGYSPINDVLYDGMIIKKLYSDWYGSTLLTQNDKVTPLPLRMNILYLDGKEFNNAFWYSKNQEMYFGLGGNDMYPFVTLDVAAHEISHGFTDQHSNLIYMDQSGSLNEAFSDMAAITASYYESNEKSVNWTMGASLFKKNEGQAKKKFDAIRFMNAPAKDGASIDDARKYPALVKSCQAQSRTPDMLQSCIVHLASGVFNKAFTNLATSPGWTPRSAFGVMIKANEDYWTASETFESAACGVKKAARDLNGDKVVSVDRTINKVFSDVGISLATCN